MERLPPVLLAALLVAVVAAGCLGGGDSPAATVTYEFVVHPPDESVENRSDIDDFETLSVMMESTQLYAANKSRPYQAQPRSTSDWTEVVDEGPRTFATFSTDGGPFEKFAVTLAPIEALHKNGSRPEIHTAPANLYLVTYGDAGNQPAVQVGDTLRYRWHFSVVKDDEDIGNSDVPEGEYFIRRLPATGPVR